MDQMRDKHLVIGRAIEQSSNSQQQIDREQQTQAILDAFQQIALIRAQIAFDARWRQKAVGPQRGIGIGLDGRPRSIDRFECEFDRI